MQCIIKRCIEKELAVGMKKGQVHQDRWLYLPIIVLVDFISLLLEPRGK